MALYEVEYSYSVPRYDIITVNAEDIDEAEIKAEKQLALDVDDIAIDLTIETIRKVN